MDKLEFVSAGLVNPGAVSRNESGDRSASPELGNQGPVEPMDPDQVEEAVDRLNENAQMVSRDLEFEVSDQSGRIIVTVKDSATEEVIRQIPPEKLMAVAESLEEVRGLLFEAEA
ncbi:flagellar protein FlaG [Aquisalimonas sp. 2447]|uniref:flagellar protein FlaG n=1 Tax=Aquisalimonas sp. 2447 TaxID=2740807 RepID=UPI0014323158|nr:flagellar protein FlaG [Aquisalimonas sp. 2447]QIT55711.1 flagellar protein FlaG [Aquisalimonas sp. 2447]